MRQMIIAATFAAAISAGLVGCKEESKTPTPGGNTATTKPAETTLGNVTEKLNNIAETAKTQPTAAIQQAQAAGAEVMAEIQKHLASAQTAAASSKFDDAESFIKKAEELKPKLSTELQPPAQTAIDGARKGVDALKKAKESGAGDALKGLVPGSK